VDAAASSDPCTDEGLGSWTVTEDGAIAEDDGYTVVYSVLMITTRELEVEFVATGPAVEIAPTVDSRVELGADEGRLLDTTEEICTMDRDIAELLIAAELSKLLVGWAFCDVRPGWLNPSRPVPLPAYDLLLTTGVGEASGAPDSLSSGE
jgi:hypothetical protein